MKSISKTDFENGKKLKGFRQQNGLSMREVAEKIGKSYRSVGYYEDGRTMPSEVIETLNSLYNLKLKSVKSTSKKSKSSKKFSVTLNPVKSDKMSMYEFAVKTIEQIEEGIVKLKGTFSLLK